MILPSVYNLKTWVDDNRAQLKPPVGNKMVYRDREFLVMVVGGPNRRKDYHIEEGEEFFYQIEGDIVVRIIEDGKPRDIQVCEGEIFLLPPRVPHSPQRPENTVGLVIERTRKQGELDHLRWYCESCGEVLRDTAFQLEDLGLQLKPIIEELLRRRESETHLQEVRYGDGGSSCQAEIGSFNRCAEERCDRQRSTSIRTSCRRPGRICEERYGYPRIRPAAARLSDGRSAA